MKSATVAFIGTMLLGAFFAWLAGYDFDYRSPGVALYFGADALLAAMASGGAYVAEKGLWTTDTITLPRATVEQALEAFELIRTSTSLADVRDRAAFAASRLTAALEAKQQAEPVGYVYSDLSGEGAIKCAAIDYDVPNGTPLYTHPQPQVPAGMVLEDFQVWFDTMFKESGVDPVWLFDVFHQWSKYAAAPKKEG